MNQLFASFRGITRPIWLLAAVNFINRCGAMIMCFLSLYITTALGYDIVYAGYAMSVYGMGAIAGQQVGGFLTDKIGYRIVQLLSLIATGLIIIGLMYVKNFYVLCTVLFCLNLVSEAFRPANSVAVSSNSNEELRTRSFSLLRVSFNLAIMFALTVGGWLITKSWHYIFWADALTCFASATALILLMPANKQPTPAPASKPSTDSQTAANNNPRQTAADKISPYTDKVYLRFIAATFLGALAFMQIVWTVPPFFKQVYHWDEFTIGCVSAINGFIVMMTEMPFVHHIENRYPTLRLIKFGSIFYALSYLALILPINFMWVAAVLYMVLISFGEMLVMPFSITWATRRAVKQQEGKFMSAYGMAYATANIVAPLIGTQLIHNFGYPTLWATIAALALVACLVFNNLPLHKTYTNLHI